MSIRLRSIFLSIQLSVFVACQEVCDIPSWNRPNDRDLDTVNVTQYGCNEACPGVLNMTIETDRTNIFGNIPFNETLYATSPTFSSASKPGDLLAITPYVNESSTWQIPAGSTLYLIQYVSTSIKDKPVPVTGFVLLPYIQRSGKLPIVAFAHGTIGVLPGCAPSSSFNLYDYGTIFPLFYQGYAVVATDYQGLGNNYTKHPYLASTVNANDVYYSVLAAKKAFPSLLSDDWVAVGHSQGGGAVMALAEGDLIKPCQDVPLNFLGAVPISPSARIADLTAHDAKYVNETGIAGALYAPYIYWALETAFPGSGRGFLTDKMMGRVHLAEAIGGCFNAFGGIGADLALEGGASAVFRNVREIGDYEPLWRFQKSFGAGMGKPAMVPMLIVQGEEDTTVAKEIAELEFNATCQASGRDGYQVQLSLYPGLDHSATPPASAPEWLAWIADRFERRPVEREEVKCYRVQRAAIDQAAAYRPLDF